MKRRTTALLALALVGAAACTGHGAAATSEALVPQEPGNLAGSSWTLIGTGNTHAVPAAVVRFVSGTPAAIGACRSVPLGFTDAGDAASGPRRVSTTILCANYASERRRYVRMLASVDTAALEGGSLNLTGPDDLRLVFDPRNQAARDLFTDEA